MIGNAHPWEPRRAGHFPSQRRLTHRETILLLSEITPVLSLVPTTMMHRVWWVTAYLHNQSAGRSGKIPKNSRDSSTDRTAR